MRLINTGRALVYHKVRLIALIFLTVKYSWPRSKHLFDTGIDDGIVFKGTRNHHIAYLAMACSGTIFS